jgi:DsbC/DsbD-like thiol-disulfide interchange protein
MALLVDPHKKILLFLVSTSLLIPGAEAQDAHPLRAQLVPEVLSVEPGTAFWVGLLLKMENGWHTYWKNPGDAGIPTTIEWRLPAGWVAGPIQWPFPRKFAEAGIVTYGYNKETFLIAELRAPDLADHPGLAKIGAHVEWLICREGCLPGQADLLLELPIKRKKPERNAPWASYFQGAREQIPMPSEDWEIKAYARGKGYALLLKPPAWHDRKLKDVFFFAEEGEVIDHSASQELVKADAGYILELVRSPYSSRLPARLRGVLFTEAGWDRSRKKPAIRLDEKVEKER